MMLSYRATFIVYESIAIKTMDRYAIGVPKPDTFVFLMDKF